MKKGWALYRGAMIALLLLLSHQGRATGHPRVRYLGIEQGLSNNAVTSIYQDQNGFLWFGTYDGLNKYDGYNITIYRNVIGDSNSLGTNSLATLTGDSHHNIWMGGQQGINIFNPVTARFFTPAYRPVSPADHRGFAGQQGPAGQQSPVDHQGPAGQQGAADRQGLLRIRDNVHQICAAAPGYMLVGTQYKGLLVFEDGRQQGLQIALENQQGDKGAYDVPAIEYDSVRHEVWLFIQQKGLYQYDLHTRRLRLVSDVIRDANCLRIDLDGRLWLGADNGLFCLDRATLRWSDNYLPQRCKVATICADRGGELWIGSDGTGVWRLPAGGMKAARLVSPDGGQLLNSNAVYAICEGQDRRKWIGTLRGGVNIIENRNELFRTITYDPPGPKNSINNFILSFCEDKDHSIWIGTDGAGLRHWDRRTNRYTSYSNDPGDSHSISSDFVTGILRDSRNEIWAATWFDGINRLDRNTGRFQRYACRNPHTGAEEKHIWLLYEDRDRELWASATNEGCLYRLNRSTGQFELFDQQVTNLQSLTEDAAGLLWGGNYSSLIRIDKQTHQYKLFPVGYPVRSIHEDEHRRLWVGTQEGGLLLFDRETGHWVRFTTAEGLPSNTILRILEDKKGNLWLSTYNGLCRFNPDSRKCRNFSPADGLQSAQFSFNGALALSSGEFLFGGIKGFNLFDPDSIVSYSRKAPVYLTRLRIMNKPIEADSKYVTERSVEQIRELTLPFNDAMLSLDFAALDYGGADKINYAYMLEGWDKGWNISNGSRTANYSNLREGNYIFRIKAGFADGSWQEESSLLHLIVLPPWYRTWWAYLLYGCCLAAIVYAYIRYTRIRERLRYEIRLAHLENEKEKELVERKLSFFTHITHEFRTPLTLIINPVREMMDKSGTGSGKDDLSFVYRNAQRLLRLVDQLLMFRKAESGADELKPATVDIVDLAREVYYCFVQGARSKRIEYLFESGSEVILLYIDRAKMEIALYNLLSNAVKYTQDGGRIVLSIEDADEEVKIMVRDNGLGIPAGIGDQVFDKFYQISRKESTSISGFGIGLYLVRQFVTAHGGRISYSSAGGEGTVFHICLPKGKQEGARSQIGEPGQVHTQQQMQSSMPSSLPSSKPSAMVPSKASSLQPSISPSMRPSTQPSLKSSPQSSTAPSMQSSPHSLMHPSSHSSMPPSPHSSIQPSPHSSPQQSKASSYQPSMQPSTEPSAQSSMLASLQASVQAPMQGPVQAPGQPLVSDKNSLLLIDNDPEMLAYMTRTFEGHFRVYHAGSGEEGLALAREKRPDLIISDVQMDGISGIELCETLKKDSLFSQTPVILLTAAASPASQLEGVKHGADDYITKPFDPALLKARVNALLENRDRLQQHFFDRITLHGDSGKISQEDKLFLERCVALVEANLDQDDFTIKRLAQEMGMSHSTLYQRVKDISGQSVNGFIRYIRLRKAAELFINTDCNVNQAAMEVGINDSKYFREQFNKLYGVNPSEYIKRYRKVFAGKYLVSSELQSAGVDQ